MNWLNIKEILPPETIREILNKREIFMIKYYPKPRDETSCTSYSNNNEFSEKYAPSLSFEHTLPHKNNFFLFLKSTLIQILLYYFT